VSRQVARESEAPVIEIRPCPAAHPRLSPLMAQLARVVAEANRRRRAAREAGRTPVPEDSIRR